jgi:hypothetical protein
MCSTNEKRSSGKCVVQSFSGLLPRISCYAINYLGVNMTAALQARRTCSGILRRAMADIVRSCGGALHYSSQRPYHVPCRGSKRGRQSHAMLVALEIAHHIGAVRTTYRESVSRYNMGKIRAYFPVLTYMRTRTVAIASTSNPPCSTRARLS